ncbi:MAG: hypothetical protein SFV54_17335 [Bryobacteraceae bacterium]|nr:hypothetical protein [Bryobacteraceae bacterium]
MRKVLVFLAAVGALGNEPLSKASDYPAAAELANFAIGAEYLARSFSLRGRVF